MDNTVKTQFNMRERLIMCFYECLGTSMLVLGYNFTNTGLAVCFNLFVGIIICNKTSGGMFNPAVTIAIYLTEGTFLKDLQLILMIMCSQIFGGYLGIILAHICLG